MCYVNFSSSDLIKFPMLNICCYCVFCLKIFLIVKLLWFSTFHQTNNRYFIHYLTRYFFFFQTCIFLPFIKHSLAQCGDIESNLDLKITHITICLYATGIWKAFPLTIILKLAFWKILLPCTTLILFVWVKRFWTKNI